MGEGYHFSKDSLLIYPYLSPISTRARPSEKDLVHRGKSSYPYQSYLRLSLRHGFSRNPEDFAIHVYMGHDLRHDALVTLMPCFGASQQLSSSIA